MKSIKRIMVLALILGVTAIPYVAQTESLEAESVKVTVFNFERAESDMQLDRYVKQGAFGKLFHIRRPSPIDKQDVISGSGVFL